MTGQPKPPRHGTYAALQWHKVHGVPPCMACKEAGRQYAAERRLNPQKRARDLASVEAARRALKLLKAAHPYEYADLYRDELDRLLKSIE